MQSVDTMDDDGKRRMHAETESRRAKRINDGIMHLRDVMLEAKFPSPKDKAGILQSTASYIQHLQQEIQRLTIANKAQKSDSLTLAKPAWPPGIDYRQVFLGSSLPQVISSMDGRFLECSDLFLRVTGYEREEILNGSIFTLTPAEDLPKTFDMLSEMMKEVENSSCSLVPPTHTPHTPHTLQSKEVDALDGSELEESGDTLDEAAGYGMKVSRRRVGDVAQPSAFVARVPVAAAAGAEAGVEPPLRISAGQKRSFKEISQHDRNAAAQAIVKGFASPVAGSPLVSRAFNKVCKMKAGLALVHVRMSMICDEESGEPKYMLCTILPLATPNRTSHNPQFTMALPEGAGQRRPSLQGVGQFPTPATAEAPQVRKPVASRQAYTAQITPMKGESGDSHHSDGASVVPADAVKCGFPEPWSSGDGHSDASLDAHPELALPHIALPSGEHSVASPAPSLTPGLFEDMNFPVRFPFDSGVGSTDLSGNHFNLDGVNSLLVNTSLDMGGMS